jgi:hypothetical protein
MASVVSLAAAPAALAQPKATINSFTYDASDPTGQSLILNATNKGSLALTNLVLELDAPGMPSRAVLTVAGTSYPSACAGGGGGSALAVVSCTFPAGLIAPATSFTITFAVTPAFPANQTNLLMADDPSGLTAANFTGPTPLPPPPPPPPPPSPDPTPDPTPAPSPDPAPSPTPDPTSSSPSSPATTAPIQATTPTLPPATCSVASGCDGNGSSAVDGQKRLTPGVCKESALAIKPDPAMMNNREVRPGQRAFGMSFMWKMSVTGGSAGCRGALSFGSPVVLSGATAMPKRELRLSARTVTFRCSRQCSKVLTGRLQIKVLSHKQLNMLLGRTLAYRVTTTSAGVSNTHTMRVFVDGHGVLRRPR